MDVMPSPGTAIPALSNLSRGAEGIVFITII
jgi:hypothetical protein